MNKKLIFLDLDGTLINTLSGRAFPNGVYDMHLNFDLLRALKESGACLFCIVSNQSGIDKGFVDRKTFEKKIAYVAACIADYVGGCCEVAWKFAPHNDHNRKPDTGMLEAALRFDLVEHDVAKSEMLMVGDASGLPGNFSDSDKRCAENFGIDYMDVNEFIKTVCQK